MRNESHETKGFVAVVRHFGLDYFSQEINRKISAAQSVVGCGPLKSKFLRPIASARLAISKYRTDAIFAVEITSFRLGHPRIDASTQCSPILGLLANLGQSAYGITSFIA
jgi:hypothetical protein